MAYKDLEGVAWPDERKFEDGKEFNFDDYMFDDFDFSDIDFGDFGGIINLPGGGGGYSYTPPTEEEIAEQQAKQAAARLAKGYGGIRVQQVVVVMAFKLPWSIYIY